MSKQLTRWSVVSIFILLSALMLWALSHWNILVIFLTMTALYSLLLFYTGSRIRRWNLNFPLRPGRLRSITVITVKIGLGLFLSLVYFFIFLLMWYTMHPA